MDDNADEYVQYVSRVRSPAFSTGEVNAILELVEKYKLFILNKSVTAVASQAKETAWCKLAKEFNKIGFEHTRSADNLKGKWENMKRDVRKISKNLIDSDCRVLDRVQARILALLSEAEHFGAVDVPQGTFAEDPESTDKEQQTVTPNNSSKFFETIAEIEDEDDSKDKKERRFRSVTFSPRECSILMQCVKKEKSHIFSKENTSKTIKLKNRAWSRVTNSFNRLSPTKRTVKVLRNKFKNLKKLAGGVGSMNYFETRNHKRLMNDESKDIKKEFASDDELDADSDHGDDNDDGDSVMMNGDKSDSNDVQSTDPLGSVLNGDSGLGMSLPGRICDCSEDKEIIKLKKELLQYQLETAKMERQRLELLMREDEELRKLRSAEAELRLRTARAEAAAAQRLQPAYNDIIH